MNKRPLSITVLSWLYITTGTVGFAYHFSELRAQPFVYDTVGVELVRLIAIICGAFMLRGHNWARWLALAWIASHVVLSAFHGWPQLAIHSLLCAVFAFFLFRSGAGRYFGAARPAPRPY